MPLQDANPTPSFGGFGLRLAIESVYLNPIMMLYQSSRYFREKC